MKIEIWCVIIIAIIGAVKAIDATLNAFKTSGISAKSAREISCSCNSRDSKLQLKKIFEQINKDCYSGKTFSKFEGFLIPQVGLKLLEMGYETEQHQEKDNCHFTVFWQHAKMYV